MGSWSVSIVAWRVSMAPGERFHDGHPGAICWRPASQSRPSVGGGFGIRFCGNHGRCAGLLRATAGPSTWRSMDMGNEDIRLAPSTRSDMACRASSAGCMAP